MIHFKHYKNVPMKQGSFIKYVKTHLYNIMHMYFDRVEQSDNSSITVTMWDANISLHLVPLDSPVPEVETIHFLMDNLVLKEVGVSK